jgi:flagellar biosynthesis protein FlhA
MGYTLVIPPAVVATHLSEVLQKHADLILTRQDVQNLLDTLKKDQPALIEELIPNVLTLGTIERVLKNLLSERIPIRDLSTILETLSDNAAMTKDPDLLSEYVRQALGRAIANYYQDTEGKINALTLDPELEQILTSAVSEAKKNGITNINGLGFVLPTRTLQVLLNNLSEEIEKLNQNGHQAILITSPAIRLYLRKLVEPVFKDLVILSFAEIPANVEIQSLGNVRLNDAG